ncbi:eukaryotic translation initiation factor 4 gamma 1-like [Amia ocellicauda]|uniref:eukaryotic translation initiation factor 4 gamma 1-like n=1 Tax=Amia ocellicauda TaxID=2972642 RepID=UPI00346439CB
MGLYTVCRSCAGDRPADPVRSYQGTNIFHPEVLVACRLRSEAGPEQVKESLCKPDQAQFAASAPKSEEPQHLPAKKTEERKKYDREFLLGFRFIAASMQKPEGMPHIADVVLEKPSGMGPRGSQQGQNKEPRKIITGVSFTSEVKLNKAEKAWKPSIRKATTADPETIKTEEMFRRMRSILNKLTPQMFHQLMRQVTELTIDTEERLKGVVDLIFEKAISEPNFSVTYANMCHCLMEFHVPTTGKPGVTVTFRKMLLSRCKTEFEKDKGSNEVVEKKQKQLDASLGEEAKGQHHRRALGNIQFIGQLFKVKMLNENTMHNCIIVKLLRKQDEESLECLCRLLSTIGKDLHSEKAKPPMDQYFNQMEQMVKERKTSSRIRFMLQDVLDLRRDNWVPRRGDQGPKTIDHIHKEAQLDEHREQIKVQQQLMNKQDNRRWGRNSVPVSKNRPIDTRSLGKISKPSGMGPRGSLQGQSKQPSKIITGVSFTAEVKLNKAEKAWKPSIRKAITEDRETIKTEETEKDKLEQQFLLDLESICASMQKLHITDVVLEKGCSGDSGSKPAEQDDIKEENFYKWRFRKDLPSLRSLERLRERAEQARKRERRTSVKHGWH